jgi:hypothetical protein
MIPPVEFYRVCSECSKETMRYHFNFLGKREILCEDCWEVHADEYLQMKLEEEMEREEVYDRSMNEKEAKG